MADAEVSATALADRLTNGLLTADRAEIASCFAPDASLQALTPRGLMERGDAAGAGELMAGWFSDCADTRLISSGIEPMVDRHHIHYRIAAMKEGRGAVEIEQQLYVDIEDGRIRQVALVCSGFRPTRPT